MARILVVEDDALNQKVFRLILERKGGFEVVITEDGDEVMDLVRNREVDLVVMDVSLDSTTLEGAPVSGIDLTRAIKNTEECSDLPVILATAHAMKGDRENLLAQSGADGYISKPITDPNELISLVNSFLEESKCT